jgi:hypothetical protein
LVAEFVQLAAVNKYIMGRVEVPSDLQDELRSTAHNKNDGVVLEKMGNSITIHNASLEGYAVYMVGPASITVTDASGVQGKVLFSNRDATGQSLEYNGTTAQKMVAGAVVLTAALISEQTFGLVQIDADSFRFQDQDAVNAMGYFVQIMAQYRSELHTKTAA